MLHVCNTLKASGIIYIYSLHAVICSSRSNRPFSCGNELSKPQTDHLNRPSSLDLGVYINIDAPLSCSGNLTGYYYTYLNKNDYVVEGTISMWSSNSHGLEQVEQYWNTMSVHGLYLEFEKLGGS